MNKSEYESRLDEINMQAEVKTNKLKIEFAMSNLVAKVGDIVTDHHQSVLVDKIGVATGWNGPEGTYGGLKLRKDLTPFKSKERTVCLQSNVTHVNGALIK